VRAGSAGRLRWPLCVTRSSICCTSRACPTSPPRGALPPRASVEYCQNALPNCVSETPDFGDLSTSEPRLLSGVSDYSTDALEEKRERVARLIGFKVVRAVFALSDTDGDYLPPPEPQEWSKPRALANLGIREVYFDQVNGNLQGWSHGTEFAINPMAVHPNKTLFHELGHIVLGHTLSHHYEEYTSHKGVMEFQAEATAYLQMNELELMDEETASHSRGYIKHWLVLQQ
jgi:hypothetical protein